MSTLSVTSINTANGTTDLTISTGNTSGAKVVTYANGSGIMFFVNSTANSAFVDSNGIFNVSQKLEVGTHSIGGYDFGTTAIIEIDQTTNSYMQVVIQNANAGNNASSDLVLVQDQGNDTVNFVDLGINGSNYNQPAFNIGGAGDAYLYSVNAALAIGTATTGKDVVFHTNGTVSTAEKMRIGANSTININSISLIVSGNVNMDSGTLFVDSVNNRVAVGGNTTPSFSLQVTGTANVSANLSVGSTMNVVTNTINLGSSTKASNGYTYLPNGLKLVWGTGAANTTTAAQTFATAFAPLYSITLGQTTNAVASLVAITASTNTTFTPRSGSTANPGITYYYMAIGA